MPEGAVMVRKQWKKPTFREVAVGLEINAYASPRL
jgi:coenzyme PQQ precursor peptide PqqA